MKRRRTGKDSEELQPFSRMGAGVYESYRGVMIL